MSSSRLTRFAAPLLAAIALFAVGVSAAAAAPKEVAYDCHEDICLLNPDNPSEVTNLTDNEAKSIDEKPVWSPDGKKVAFISRFETEPIKTRNLYVMEPEAPGESINIATQVTHFTNGEYVNEAVWSPDGTRIAFVVGTSEGNYEVEIANSDGTTAMPLVVAEHGSQPTWAPESGRLAYAYEGQVYVKNADGSGTATPLAGATGREPVWSPDGAHIAFGAKAGYSGFDLGILPPGGGTPVTLTAGSQFIFASWSPLGTQIAYEQTAGGSNWRIANGDGSGDHELLRMKDLSLDGPAPSWSPDGSRIVFQGYFYGSEPGTNGVYMQDTDGSGSITTLVEGEKYLTSPDWKPNPATAPTQFIPAPGGAPPPAATSPLPPTLPKPKTVWITKRIPVTRGPDYTIIVASYGCAAPVCNVGSQGTSRGSKAAGLSLTTASRPQKKPKPIVVGKGKTTIADGQTGQVPLHLNKAGAKLLEKNGSLKIAVTLTVTSPGAKPVTEGRSVTVVLKGAKKAKPKTK